MDDGRSWCMILFFLFLACCSLFTASTAALTNANDAQLKERADSGDPSAKRLAQCLKIRELDHKLRTATLSAALLSGLFGMIWAAPALSRLFLAWMGEDLQALAAVLAILICGLAVAFLVLSFGLTIPRYLGIHYAETWAYRLARLFPVLLWGFAPLTGPVRVFSTGVAKLLGADPAKDAGSVTEEEIRMLVDTGSEMGFIEESQKKMINNIFEFDDTAAGDIMTHRTELVALEKDDPVSEVVRLAIDEGFSRLPVYEGDLDNILGFIHVKDLLCLIGEKTSCEALRLDDFIRPVVYLPEHVKCRTVFAEFKKNQTSMAVVVDEYGGTEGIITMEDILESIVGDIEDEYDEKEKNIQQIDASTYLVEGVTELEELQDLLGIPFEKDEDYDTLGGFMTHMLGRIPKEDEHPSIAYEGCRFTAVQVEERRISKVRIVKETPPQPEE